MSEIQDQVEELKKLQTQINELSEKAEEKGIDCSDIDPEVLNFLDYESLNNILSSSNIELLNSYDDEVLEQSALDPVIKHIFTGWQINQSSEDYNISFLDESGDVELEKKVVL